MKKGKFDWKITAKKVGRDAAIVIVSGIITAWQDNGMYLALIPVLKAVLNIVKHKYQIELGI